MNDKTDDVYVQKKLMNILILQNYLKPLTRAEIFKFENETSNRMSTSQAALRFSFKICLERVLKLQSALQKGCKFQPKKAHSRLSNDEYQKDSICWDQPSNLCNIDIVFIDFCKRHPQLLSSWPRSCELLQRNRKFKFLQGM